MPWKLKLADNNACIEITYSGTVSAEELQEALVDLLKLGHDRGVTNILADCREMVGGHSALDLYHLIALYEKFNVPYEMKEAILLPALPATKEEVKFYETACLNKGYNVRLFDKIENALEWLCN